MRVFIVSSIFLGIGIVLGSYFSTEPVVWDHVAYKYAKDLGSAMAAFVAVFIVGISYLLSEHTRKKVNQQIVDNTTQVMLAELMVFLSKAAAQKQFVEMDPAPFKTGIRLPLYRFEGCFKDFATNSVNVFDKELIQKIAVHERETVNAYATLERLSSNPSRGYDEYEEFLLWCDFVVINILIYMCTLSKLEHTDENKRILLDIYKVANPDQFLIDIEAKMNEFYRQLEEQADG